MGLTSTLWARYSGGQNPPLDSIDAGNALITQAFRDQNEFSHGVRPSHVLEVLADPDGFSRVDVGDGYSILLATRKVDAGPYPYVLLVLAHERPGERPAITAGYRLLDNDPRKLLAIAGDPTLAFRFLLDRFACPIRVGDQVGIFIPAAVVQQTAVGTAIVEGLGRTPESLSIEALIKVNHAKRATEVQWAYALDTGAYRRSLG